MINLVLFSLKRRFNNPSFKVLLILVTLIIGLGVYLDKVVNLINEDAMILKVQLNNMDEELFKSLNQDSVEIDENSALSINFQEGVFHITSQHPLSTAEENKLLELIFPYYQSTLPIEVVEVLESYAAPEVIFQSESDDNLETKHNSLFIVITAIYFMMIGFVGQLASEVVSEKTNNILELIGTSVSLKTNYYAKLMVGWLSILVQSGSVVLIGGLILLSRYLYDKAEGIISFYQTHGFLSEGITNSLKDSQMLIDLGIGLLFLITGILVVQLFLVVISTKVTTVEEAGALQNPVYIIMLFVYYGAMILNNPLSMTSGWGYRLSMIPIINMIFMPTRLMLYEVPIAQWVIPLLINVIILIFITKWGETVYEKNILNFSSKLKKSHN